MEEQEVLVKVEGLSKKFCKDLKKSLWYGVQDLFSNLSGNKKERQLREQEFWAVKDINFLLRRGECLGIIGHNGAGKSTLLKILNGLIKPDEGKVSIKGRVGALIELGAGFNPILTGRENIYNNGAILGFSRKEITQKLETIIDFAEIREFIDMPVMNYSSGMKVRLGFAVAAQMEPDILIIDEVLAVGDLGFVMKCFKAIDNLLAKTAVIYVSHNMPTVSRLCDKIILLSHGESEFRGKDVSKGIDLYYSSFGENDKNVVFTDNSIELIEAKILNVQNFQGGKAQLKWMDDLKISLHFSLRNNIRIPLFRILIYDKEQRPLAILDPNVNEGDLTINNNKLEFIVTHPRIQLSKGFYSINITAFKRGANEPILRINGVLSFQIIHQEDHFQPFLLPSSFKNINHES